MKLEEIKTVFEKYTLPITIAVGITTSVSSVYGNIATYGLKVISISIFILSIIWTIHTFRARKTSIIDPKYISKKYNKKTRTISIIVSVLLIIPVVLTFTPPKEFKLPDFAINVDNRSSENIQILPKGEFYIKQDLTPFMDSQVASGKFIVKDSDLDVNLTIDADKMLAFSCEFLNSKLYEYYYQRGDCTIQFILYTNTGKVLSSASIDFTLDYLIAEMIYFKIDE